MIYPFRCSPNVISCSDVPPVEMYVMIIPERSTSTININGVNHIARPVEDVKETGVAPFQDISLTSNLDSIQMQSEYSNGLLLMFCILFFLHRNQVPLSTKQPYSRNKYS